MERLKILQTESSSNFKRICGFRSENSKIQFLKEENRNYFEDDFNKLISKVPSIMHGKKYEDIAF